MDAFVNVISGSAVLISTVGALLAFLATRVAETRLDRTVKRREAELREQIQVSVTQHPSNRLPTSKELDRLLSQALRPVSDSGVEGSSKAVEELSQAVEDVFTRVDRLEKADKSLGVRSTALLEVYHRQGLTQSRISFWFSLLLGTVGVGVIAFAVLTRSAEVGTYVAGAITEAVAGLIFTQSTQARQVMSESFDRARDDRRLEEALTLADRMDEGDLRGALHAVLVLELVGAKTHASVLPGLQRVSMPRGGDTEKGN